MMKFKKFLSYFIPQEEVAVIGIFDDGQQVIYDYIKVKKQKKELKIIAKEFDLKTFEELNPLISGVPIILTFLGKNILYSSGNNAMLLNNNPNDYYTNAYISTENYIFSGIGRKEVIDRVLKTFEDLNSTIVEITIGPFAIANLSKLFSDHKILRLKDIQLHFEKNELKRFEKSDKVQDDLLKVEEDNVTSTEVYLLATALNYYYPSEKIKRIEQQENFDQNRIEAKYKNQTEFLAKTFTLISILLFSLNFLIYNFYFNKNEKLNLMMSSNLSNIEDLRRLEIEYNRKSSLIAKSGLARENFLSFYINEVGGTVPFEVTLDVLDIIPTKVEGNNSKRVEFSTKNILVGGVSYDVNGFDAWLTELRDKNWLKSIDIVSYKRKKNEIIDFLFKITLK